LGTFSDPNLLYGAGIGDDAGVYKISEGLAIVQSVDIITPIVDDPYTYGRIAGANSLSDIYAMGARPITALNILACSLPPEVMREILRGGADCAREAGAALLGGHSVNDAEPKYGLAVTGLIDPRVMVTNQGARPGDALILTKKIGVGILSAMAKHGAAPAVWAEAVTAMMRLNRHASEAMMEVGVHACTDITGFGLLGHALNIATASKVRLVLEYSKIPKYEGVEAHAIARTKGGGQRNRKGIEQVMETTGGVTHENIMVLCDPQTSGGLFISVAPEKAEALAGRLRDGGGEASAIVGYVVQGPGGTIEVRP
jgi:selenide,water dikinase